MPTVTDKSVQGIIDVLGPMSSGGGVTSVSGGTGISVNQSTGAVTITNTAPGGVTSVAIGSTTSGSSINLTGLVPGASYAYIAGGSIGANMNVGVFTAGSSIHYLNIALGGAAWAMAVRYA